MDIWTIIGFVIGLLASFLIGILKGAADILKNYDGSILMAVDDGFEDPSVMVQFNGPIDFSKKEYVILKISKTPNFYYLSHK